MASEQITSSRRTCVNCEWFVHGAQHDYANNSNNHNNQNKIYKNNSSLINMLRWHPDWFFSTVLITYFR